MEDLTHGGTYKEIEFRVSDANGQYRWCRLRASAQFDTRGQARRVIGMLADINKQKQTEEALLYQAERDGLTQLYNRSTVRKLVEEPLPDL